MKTNKPKLFRILGIVWLLTGLVVLLVVFWPQVSMDINYFLQQRGIIPNPYISTSDYEGLVKGISDGKIKDEYLINTDNLEQLFVNTDNAITKLSKSLPDSKYKDFGILIPKINADSPIVPSVDPYDINIYKEALGKGIAHANTSVLPDGNGNIFLFAHSGRNFYDSIGVNVQFYMLDKLSTGDLIVINYQNGKYIYKVEEYKIVEQTDAEYMFKDFQYNKDPLKKHTNTLVLMSCWPAGMNVKRQIVIASQLQ